MYSLRIPEFLRVAIVVLTMAVDVALPAQAQQDAAFQQYWKVEPQW